MQLSDLINWAKDILTVHRNSAKSSSSSSSSRAEGKEGERGSSSDRKGGDGGERVRAGAERGDKQQLHSPQQKSFGKSAAADSKAAAGEQRLNTMCTIYCVLTILFYLMNLY